ncbi:hypothetical protein QJS04_geneDACA017981 [Acorus gramineus]|uniref:Uncharacterized protein n=1 Tax=Acorus gramineus TaxID=55184 RepID=A0AAV9A4Y1_ACOGR|nr:hypothetical protein QJS04_geneDACA017981 [Acorus gramineus]
MSTIPSMAPKKRLRPTTSNMKNRSKDIGFNSGNVEITIETQEKEQREEVEVEIDSEIDEASKKGPFPGGPVNNELNFCELNFIVAFCDSAILTSTCTRETYDGHFTEAHT